MTWHAGLDGGPRASVVGVEREDLNFVCYLLLDVSVNCLTKLYNYTFACFSE